MSALDSTAAGCALAALTAAGLWEGCSVFLLTADPVPFYSDPKGTSAQELLRDWRRMFPGAMGLQAKLVVLGSAASAVTAWGLRGGGGTHDRAAVAFGMAAAMNVGIFAYTMAKIMPVNHRLLHDSAAEKEESDEGIMRLLKQWGEMHGVRTAMGAVVLAATAYGTHALLTRA